MSLPEEPLPLRFLGDQTHIQIAYGSKLIAICRRMECGFDSPHSVTAESAHCFALPLIVLSWASSPI